MIDDLDSTASANLVAIDIAKDWNVVLVQETSGARRSFKVANRKPDHDRPVVFLKSLPGRVVAPSNQRAIITGHWLIGYCQKALRWLASHR